MSANPIYYFAGLNVGVFSPTQLVIEPFGLWMWGPIGTPGFGGQLFNLVATLYPDLTTIGPNGMDANPNGAGHMPPDYAYDLHAFGNPATEDVIFYVSAKGRTLDITPPSGYTHYRKIPYGVIVRNGTLQINHTANWPMPTVTFDGIEIVIATYGAATGGWMPVNLAKLIPENARQGLFRAHITNGSATVWASPSNEQPGNQLWKTMADNQTGIVGPIPIRVDSTETIWFWTAGSGHVDIILDGFQITEATD